MRRSKIMQKGFAGLLAIALLFGTMSQGMTAVAADTGEQATSGEQTASEQTETEQNQGAAETSDSDLPEPALTGDTETGEASTAGFDVSAVPANKGEADTQGGSANPEALQSGNVAEDDGNAPETSEEPPVINSVSESYIYLHVKKEWPDSNRVHEPVTVRLSPALGTVNEIVLSSDNGWEGTFADLPAYDSEGHEIAYSVVEDTPPGYSPSYGSVSETARQNYWVMINAPQELENGRIYVIAAQDWGQAMYFGNPHVYYFLKQSDDGADGLIGLHRIENTDTVFTGPKTGNGTEALVIGGKTYDEYLDPESEVTQNISAGETWRLGTQGGGWVLQNEALMQLITLRGDNQWWNYWNPHVYSYINSNEDGWHGDENINYSHILDISAANDGMARIASTQFWGNNQYETQYLYLDLTPYAQKSGAIGDYNSAGQFKFFTPVTKIEQSVTITNAAATIDIPVEKKWVGKAAESATVILKADGTEVARKKLTEADGWKYTFSGLPEYDSADWHEIIYTVSEEPVENYTTEISGSASEGFTVTNTIIGRQITAPVTGDNSNITMYAALIFISAALIVLLSARRRKHKTKQ